jgi:hypothetical protein
VDEDPACDNAGKCVAPKGAKGITNCVHCGKELIEREGRWYTWDVDMHEMQTPQDQE